MKRKCVVCNEKTGSERNRLCNGCLVIGEHYFQTVESLRERQPKRGFINLMSGLIGSFFRLPQSQLDSVKRLVADCGKDGFAIGSSEVVRVALQYGLLALASRSTGEIAKAINAHHQNNARINTEGLQNYR